MVTTKDYLKLHFIVFLWGFSAILGRLVSIPSSDMILYRALIAVGGLAVVIYLTRGVFRVSRNDYLLLFGISFIVAIHWLTFFGSARVSNVSVSLVGFSTNSLWAAFLEPWFNKTKIKKLEVLLGLMVVAGLGVIFSFDFAYPLGLFLGIVSGFTSALFSVFNAKLVRRIPAFTITFYEMLNVFIILALFLPLYNISNGYSNWYAIPTPVDWIYIALLALACSVYAYSVAVELMKRVSVFLIQLTLNLEPLYGMTMALIIFGSREQMNVNFYAGALIILLAVSAYPLIKKRHVMKGQMSG